jgi:hypothetical protein
VSNRDFTCLFAEGMKCTQLALGYFQRNALGLGIKGARSLTFGVNGNAGVRFTGQAAGQKVAAHLLEHGDEGRSWIIVSHISLASLRRLAP